MIPNTLTILIIDPDAASRNYLSTMLVKEGYKVLTAALGREGLISAWKDLPTVIIFDPNLPDLASVDLVRRLRSDRRTAEVMCLALSSREDPETMSALLAAGCNEYIVKSANALPRLFQLLPQAFETKPVPLKRGRMITFISAKGGMGTSSLCANLAMCAATLNPDKRIAVLDLVLPIGSIANLVGADDRINLISAALQKPETINSVYFTANLPQVSGWSFHLLAGSQDPASISQLTPERTTAVVTAMLESHDYLFVDAGRTLSRLSLPVLQQSQCLVLVLGTDLVTCTATRTVIEYLRTVGVDTSRIYAIQNRSLGLEGLTRDEAEKAIDTPIAYSIPYLAENLTVANNRHEPFVTRFPNDATALTFQTIASQLLERADKSKS